LLNNSRGIILDDIELIESLKVSKDITKAVNDKIKVSSKKEEELNDGLRKYIPVAIRGKNIYFIIQ
jgi:dynein heavy chain